MVYLCFTSQGSCGGFAPGHQNVYLNVIIPDALLPWAQKVLSCPNLENRLFLILNVNPNGFASLMRGEVRDVEEDFISSLEIPMRFQKIIFTIWGYSLHWAEKLIRQLQAWLPWLLCLPICGHGVLTAQPDSVKKVFEKVNDHFLSPPMLFNFALYTVLLSNCSPHWWPETTQGHILHVQPEAQFHNENCGFCTWYI